ncbi:RNA polymerase sigma-B factor [Nocardioides exalbidus]|uniref:RNA polymerase sigma-B factor n=1 Tax=Nocardioides exalbidus TaxID=402596 RepID=A0A1H4WF17_9ACTN|nr:sigma-70 family RNA polymerase sigma factor [Nocardioides exalbidus]SEC91154.1 RNA polymerase sigma-B factor [Nocardioides exalbidus]
MDHSTRTSTSPSLDPAAAREEAVREMILVNLPVARRIARKFAGRGCDLEDLEQTAYVALVKAAQRFDPSAGHDFLTYAVPCITGETKRHFRDLGWMVRPPRPVQELRVLVERERGRPEPATGRPPTDRELADRLDVPVELVRQALEANGCFSPSSLDRPVTGTTDLALADTLKDLRSATDYEIAEARVVLGPALAGLAPSDRRLLHLSFVEERTQREIGDELGLSQSQVSRLVRDALTRLREAVAGTAGSCEEEAA